jgi:acyl transferase domain-containing protein
VLDDALHYMKTRDLVGNHNTSTHPKFIGVPNQLTTSNTVGLISDNNTEEVIRKYSSLFLLSAADEDGINRLAVALEKHLSQRGNVTTDYLRDLAFTLSSKRSKLPWKAFAVAPTVEELRKRLATVPFKPTRAIRSPTIYFVFTGQGVQWAAMGVDLIDRYDVFRDTMHFADEYLRSLGSTWSMLSR